ncbi:MAG TPA: hypothetical protein VFE46_11425 [Pirellulales bacterium]|jgi:hypothetical protein|nr:hypothetical protein [Pirellulales bacterium]
MFKIGADETFANYSVDSNTPGYDHDFGRQVLDKTWINHQGTHGKESTPGLIAPGAETNPILRGMGTGNFWVPTDVYRVRFPMLDDCQLPVLDEILSDITLDSSPVTGAKTEPTMPVAWIRTAPSTDLSPATSRATNKNRPSARVFATTMGASQDLQSEGFRPTAFAKV